MHPFTPDLSQLTDTQLQENITAIGKKIMVATRSNSGALWQLQLIYQDYVEENKRREDKKLRELLAANNKSFDDIINIE